MRLLLLAIALLPLACASTAPTAPDVAPIPAATAPTTLGVGVAAWAEYEHDGVRYLHLWCPGAPKSVFVIRADDADPGFVETLRRELPQRPTLFVELAMPATVAEAPTYVRSASIGEQEWIVDGVSHRIPATHRD